MDGSVPSCGPRSRHGPVGLAQNSLISSETSSAFRTTDSPPSEFRTTDSPPSEFRTTDSPPSEFRTTDSPPSEFRTTDSPPSEFRTTDSPPSEFRTTDSPPSEFRTTDNPALKGNISKGKIDITLGLELEMVLLGPSLENNIYTEVIKVLDKNPVLSSQYWSPRVGTDPDRSKFLVMHDPSIWAKILLSQCDVKPTGEEYSRARARAGRTVLRPRKKWLPIPDEPWENITMPVDENDGRTCYWGGLGPDIEFIHSDIEFMHWKIGEQPAYPEDSNLDCPASQFSPYPFGSRKLDSVGQDDIVHDKTKGVRSAGQGDPWQILTIEHDESSPNENSQAEKTINPVNKNAHGIEDSNIHTIQETNWGACTAKGLHCPEKISRPNIISGQDSSMFRLPNDSGYLSLGAVSHQVSFSRGTFNNYDDETAKITIEPFSDGKSTPISYHSLDRYVDLCTESPGEKKKKKKSKKDKKGKPKDQKGKKEKGLEKSQPLQEKLKNAHNPQIKKCTEISEFEDVFVEFILDNIELPEVFEEPSEQFRLGYKPQDSELENGWGEVAPIPVNFTWDEPIQTLHRPNYDKFAKVRGPTKKGQGVEVCTPIMSAESYEYTVKALMRQLKSTFQIEFNKTCGLHVHVGCGKGNHWSLYQMKNIAKAVVLFEEIIDLMHPHHRRIRTENWLIKSNRHNSLLSQFSVLRIFQKFDKRVNEQDNNVVFLEMIGAQKFFKYNFSCNATYGTIEFRQGAGHCDENQMLEWLKFIIQFVEAALDTSDDVWLQYATIIRPDPEGIDDIRLLPQEVFDRFGISQKLVRDFSPKLF